MRNLPNGWNSRDEGPLWPIVCIVNRSAATGPGGGMEEVNQALAQFKEDLAADERGSRRTEVAAVLLEETVECIDFSPVQDFEAPPPVPSGGANLAQGIEAALDLLEQRTQECREKGIPFFPPMVLLLTAGGLGHIPSEELAQARQRLQYEEEEGHVRFFAFATKVGDLADLHQLCPPYRPPLCLEDTELNVVRLIVDGFGPSVDCGYRGERTKSGALYLPTLEPFDEYLN